MNIFCKRLKELRKEKNLTLMGIEKALGIPHSSYARWENGESQPRVDELNILCDFFDVSADYLIGRADY